jgi:hypothetical protein
VKIFKRFHRWGLKPNVTAFLIARSTMNNVYDK